MIDGKTKVDISGIPAQIPGYERPHRLCHYCGFHKSLSDFRRGPKCIKCKDCYWRYQHAWSAANPEKVAQAKSDFAQRNPNAQRDASRRSRRNNPEGTLNAVLKSRYGITTWQYQSMLKKQGGLCAICRQACKERRRLSVDHDHANGQVRGLLCNSCNVSLGHFNDDPGLLQRAIDYLNQPRTAP